MITKSTYQAVFMHCQAMYVFNHENSASIYFLQKSKYPIICYPIYTRLEISTQLYICSSGYLHDKIDPLLTHCREAFSIMGMTPYGVFMAF